MYDNTVIRDILLYAIFLNRPSHINKFMHSFLTKDEMKQIFISYQICKVVTESITDTTDYELA